MPDEFQEALDKIFAADSELYDSRGFARRIGYGKNPALINIDLANAWTREGHAFTCDGMDVIIPGVQNFLMPRGQKAFRSSIQRPPIRIRKARTRIWVSGRRKSRSRS